MANESGDTRITEKNQELSGKLINSNDFDPEKKMAHTMPPDSCTNSPKKHQDRKKVLTYEDILKQLEERIKKLLATQDFTVSSVKSDLKFIQKQTRYNPDVVIHKRLNDKIIQFGIAHVYMQVWKSVSNVNFFESEHSVAFKNLQTILSIIWNCTDKSSILCECLVKCGVVQLALNELNADKISQSDLKDENMLYLVKAYLGMLHNIVRLCSDSRKVFRSAGAVKILQNYITSTQLLVKAKSYLTLSYLINEEENDLINANDDNLAFLIRILHEALASDNHFAQTCAFWAYEITDGLNHLAVNDNNKIAMGRLGIFPLYIKMLQSDSQEEQALGTAGMWILAFKNENKLLLKEEPGCLEALRTLALNSSHDSIRRAARGALFVVKTAPSRPPTQQVNVDDESIPHIMISYHHKSAQSTMLKVKNRLRALGYKMWMDVDNMFGSTLESMALAIEKSCVILVCMTQGYKDSPSCRTEAEYTYRLKKGIIPLVLQSGYDPDGWLGALVGSRLHYDFSLEELIPTELPKLVRELGNRGKLPRGLVSSDYYDHESSLDGVSSLPPDTPTCSSMTRTKSFHSYKTEISQSSIGAWGSDDIKEWLDSHSLGETYHLFESFTGDLLLQLKKVQAVAPEYYYRTVENQFKFDLVTSLKFSKALEELQ